MKSMLPSLVQARKSSYTYLDNLFSLETGINIEEYFNKKKIDWAKKLLAYYNLTVTEVTYQLGYTSSDNFVEQFKQIAGITPYQFKQIKTKQHIPVLEEA
jgi:AraC-like DNA-binding protein